MKWHGLANEDYRLCLISRFAEFEIGFVELSKSLCNELASYNVKLAAMLIATG